MFVVGLSVGVDNGVRVSANEVYELVISQLTEARNATRGIDIAVGDTASVTFEGVAPPEQPTRRMESVSRKMNLGVTQNTPPMKGRSVWDQSPG